MANQKKSVKRSAAGYNLRPSKKKKSPRTIDSRIRAENEDILERKKLAAYRYGPDMKNRFLKIFVKKVGIDFLKDKWPKGEIDITYFSWSNMCAIANDYANERIWQNAKTDSLAKERPVSTIPPEFLVYNPKLLLKKDKKENLNPMLLTRAKANTILEEATDLISHAPEAKMNDVVVKYLRKEEIGLMIANMMLNTFMADFDPEGEIIEGEYALENQSPRCQSLAKQLKIYAEEAQNTKKPFSRRVKASGSGISLKQIKKAKQTFKHLKVDDDLGISSADPTRIFGSKAVLLYNSKYRKVTFLEAPPNGILSIKGSSVFGFDKDSAIQKTCKDPRNDLDWSTRPKAKKSVKNLKGKAYLGNGRSNPNTIILAAF